MNHARSTGPDERLSFCSAAVHAARITLRRAAALGWVANSDTDLREGLGELLTTLEEAQIGFPYVSNIRQALTKSDSEPTRISQDLQRLFGVLGEHSAPQRESQTLLRTFDADQLAELLLVSSTSVRGYAQGETKAPHTVAARIHWLALIVGYLTGTYNRHGVRRWFERPRHALDGASPKEALLTSKQWTPDSEGARAVERLAKSLIGMLAT